MLEAARAAAEEALIEQRIIMADPEAYQAFLTRLDQAPAPNDALRKTMQTLRRGSRKNDLRPEPLHAGHILARSAAAWSRWITG